MSAYAPHILGRWGEAAATRFLRARGWRILARNYRFGRREVDVVVSRGRVLAFVEVKTRAGDGFGRPQDAITRLKRREIEAVAAHYLATRPIPAHTTVRFDAVTVERRPGEAKARIEHIPDAWRPGWP